MNLKIAICGVTGLIGRSLSKRIVEEGGTVISITRKDLFEGVHFLMKRLQDVDVVVNLAGSPIMGRWTPRKKQCILSSRVQITRLLVSTVKKMENPPNIFISASAVGIYDQIEVHDEFSLNYAKDFLSDVCRFWEKETFKLNETKIRPIIFRLGVVLSPEGGALKQMLFPFKFGVGAVMGSGKQYFPWVHIDDVVKAFMWSFTHPRSKGIYNLVAPQIVRNYTFTMTLGSILKRPVFLRVPEWFLKMTFGEGAQVVTKGQQVIPHRLLAARFEFSYPRLKGALIQCVKK